MNRKNPFPSYQRRNDSITNVAMIIIIVVLAFLLWWNIDWLRAWSFVGQHVVAILIAFFTLFGVATGLLSVFFSKIKKGRKEAD
jgi:hypothetical protein